MAQTFGRTHETILLVEDHSALRKLVEQILGDASFSVIPASSAREAIQLEAEYPGTIDLLLADERMRSMSGSSLAKRLKERRPQMYVMLMSGLHGGALPVLDYGWHYIEKPFTASALVSKIKDVLRGETLGQSTDQFDALEERRRPLGRVPGPAFWRARRGA